MKLVIIASLLFAIAAYARPGETLDQLKVRFGIPKIRAGKEGEIWTFQTKQMTIVVQAAGYTSATSKMETYTKLGGEKFTVEESALMLGKIDPELMTEIADEKGETWWVMRLQGRYFQSHWGHLDKDKSTLHIAPTSSLKGPKLFDEKTPEI